MERRADSGQGPGAPEYGKAGGSCGLGSEAIVPLASRVHGASPCSDGKMSLLYQAQPVHISGHI